jgi:alkylhydroperoxidase/carboxymuconolactone decarboxylase family protein YurZ
MPRTRQEEVRQMDESELREEIRRQNMVPSRWQEVLLEHSPPLLEAYLEWSRSGEDLQELDPKTKEFLIIALDCAVRWPSPFIDNHIRKALLAGASVVEVIEVIGVTARLLGPHMLNHGLSALSNVLESGDFDE